MFSKQYRLGTVFDIPLNISQLWIVVFLIATYTVSRQAALTAYIDVINTVAPLQLTTPLFGPGILSVVFAAGIVLGLYVSIVLHEFGHIYGAKKNDVPVDGITLWVLGGAARITEQPECARSEFELTIAGPLVSLSLAIIAYGLAHATAFLGIEAVVAFFLLLALANTGMLLLNLIPAFPLDGGRLLRSALTALLDYERGTEYTTRIGKLFAIGIFTISVFSLHLIGVLLSGFVFLAARAEGKRVANADSPGSHGADATPLVVTGNTFVLETDVGAFSINEVSEILRRHNGQVDIHVSAATDVIVVPDGETEMYRTIAANYDTEIVTVSVFTDKLQSFMADAKPSRTTSNDDNSPVYVK